MNLDEITLDRRYTSRLHGTVTIECLQPTVDGLLFALDANGHGLLVHPENLTPFFPTLVVVWRPVKTGEQYLDNMDRIAEAHCDGTLPVWVVVEAHL